MLFKHKKQAPEEDLEIMSLSDLPVKEGNIESPVNSSSPQESFEFFTDQFDSENYTFPGDVIFCGKNMSHRDNESNENNLSALFRSNSFSRPVVPPFAKKRAESARFDSLQNVQKVNITALTSMSTKSRRIMFMFGPVKFEPEMELSSIKQRQARRSSKTAGETRVLVKNKGGPVKSRPHLANVLTKSFGCFSVGKHSVALPRPKNILISNS